MSEFLKKQRFFDRIKDPLVDFVKMEAFGGIVLMAFTVLALGIANSSVGEDFLAYWSNYFGFHFGDWKLSKTLIHWINDGLMAVFFFVVGLEIKREMLTGRLSSIKNARLPIFAVIGGMLVPALIYVFFNQAGPGADGWGVPMATDIAFALGILILLGKRIPLSLKLLLTSIAIVDDIGAVIVIALFYTSEIDWMYLVYGGGVYALLWCLNIFKVRSIPVYILLGLLLWYAMLKSGVHATLAGVFLALTIPARANRDVFEFIKSGTSLLTQMEKLPTDSTIADKDKHIQSSVETIEANCKEVVSPLHRLEHALHPWVAYLIIPLFAFANAGIIINHQLLGQVFEPISLGIILGLFIGKPLGIYLFALFGVRLGFAEKPNDVRWAQIIGIGFLGGIGFTMSFFVSQLAFADPATLSLAKMAVLIASVLSGFIGFMLLKKFSKEPKSLILD